MAETDKTIISLNDLLERCRTYMPEEDVETLRRAWNFAVRVHGDKPHPESGRPYMEHLLGVVEILLSMRLDVASVVSGLLHGVLKEDSALLAEMKKEFGDDVAAIVNGATRITDTKFNSTLTYQAENIRKLLLAMASDIRVLLVKLADRLHDLRSLEVFDPDRQKELARENMELYAPLASRLGIDWMKRELEDLSFKYLHPAEYEDLIRHMEISTVEREAYVEEVKDILRRKLAENNLYNCRIIGRPKHLFSIYKKTVAQKIPVSKVYDKVAFRILVSNIKECYEALGTVHANWSPVPGRIKDFISTPKSNNYQSLHTTVVGPRGHFMEVQIRTEEMDRIAQEGVAAHWAYKEGKAISSEDAQLSKWLKQLIQWLQELKDPKEFLESVKGGLVEKAEIYALTPNGEVKEFAEGSTPIDFAYSIHTEVGNKCSGAKVNGRIVPLKYKMQNGDLVEIITSAGQRPRRGWLNIVKTSRAKSRIRSWLRRQEHEKAINVGREICERELRKHDTTLKKIIKTGHIKKLLKDVHCNSLDDLLAKVGSGKVTINTIVKELQPAELRREENDEARALQELTEKSSTRGHKESRAGLGIEVEGVDDMLVKISNCCLPVPGDDIMGFITTGRGISIHKSDCPNLHATDPQRRIEVSWSSRESTVHRVQIQVLAQNQRGMLASLGNTLSHGDANIVELNAYTTPDNVAVNDMIIEVANLDHLRAILQNIRQIDGIIEARRK